MQYLPRDNRYMVGVAIALLGGTFLSLSGIMIRNIEAADGWQILFYRSLATFLTIFVFLVFQYRGNIARRFADIGGAGLLAALVLSVGSIFYIMALLNTTVANVVFIIGASPLLAALAGWLFLRERVTRASLASMFAAILGIGLMFADGLVSGGMLGNVFALCLAIMYVFYLLILRGNRHVDMMPATCLSGLFTAMIVLAFVVDFAVSRHDLVIILALGSVQFGFGFMCLTWSTRYIPAAEVALFSLSEAVLNPIWVWLGVGETPSLYTLAGSAVVLAAVMTYSIMAIRRERAIRAGASASGHS
ncbi:MAG: DMT family transporter [Gammaproteobacteria bacterium]|nr:DMT family transporter [Gammaproteobacteria bacterium]MXY63897.1 DMT family transporter [Gammaproteobacteria bacterium]MYG67568.1 DMT family transporter [Gammaproteobacteria bacterium]